MRSEVCPYLRLQPGKVALAANPSWPRNWSMVEHSPRALSDRSIWATVSGQMGLRFLDEGTVSVEFGVEKGLRDTLERREASLRL